METLPSPLRVAAGRVVDRCFRRGTSLFAPRRRLWTAEQLDDLAGRIGRAATRARTAGGRPASFAERWQRTLARADEAAVALAAEILYVHLLFPASVSGARKRELLGATLDQLDDPPVVPRDLDAALDHGVAPVGMAYTRQRLIQLAWLAAAAARWQQLPGGERRAALDEPRRAAAALAGVPVPGGHPQRAALLHLLHPAVFPPVTSGKARRAILRAFAAHVPDAEDDPDCALAAVYSALAATHGPGVSFFDPQVAVRWR